MPLLNLEGNLVGCGNSVVKITDRFRNLFGAECRAHFICFPYPGTRHIGRNRGRVSRETTSVISVFPVARHKITTL